MIFKNLAEAFSELENLSDELKSMDKSIETNLQWLIRGADSTSAREHNSKIYQTLADILLRNREHLNKSQIQRFNSLIAFYKNLNGAV
jgi:hypothetical protein